MTHSPPTIRGLRRVAILTATLLVVLPASAQTRTDEEIPDGIPAGPWILTPSFESDVTADDNIFRRPADDPLGTPSDVYARVLAGLGAMLPFRASRMYLDWTGSYYDYKEQDFERDLEQDFEFQLDLNFGSGERLTFADSYTRGFQDVQRVDEGLELTFDGRAYDLNTWFVQLERREPRRAGYTFRLRRADLNFEGDEPASFFDYRGFDGIMEYRHPVAGSRWLLGRVTVRRYRHYEVGGPVGEPFRRELSEAAEVGITGTFRGGSPYVLRLGLGTLDYEIEESKGFDGLVGLARARFPLGSSSGLDVTLRRRALPSNFASYYINQEIRLEFDRRWRNDSRVGARGVVVKNDYAELLIGTVCDDVLRRDTRYVVDAFAEVTIERRVALRVTASRQSRSSNCEPAEFDSNSISAGMGIRWY